MDIVTESVAVLGRNFPGSFYRSLQTPLFPLLWHAKEQNDGEEMEDEDEEAERHRPRAALPVLTHSLFRDSH